MQQPDWLHWAWRELGVHEIAGGGDNPRIIEMFKDVGHPAIRDDEVPWCAAFLGACLERSGRPATRSLMARSYLKWGHQIPEPKLGAVAVLTRGPDPALGHVGFVVGDTEAHVFLLGGNQANAVSVAAFDKSRVLEYRWPDANVGETAENDRAVSVDAVTAAAAPASAEPDIFDLALRHVLVMEGGFSDDPYDPGGPTNKGITLKVFARWIGEKVTAQSQSRLLTRLKRIPDAMVREIYNTRYWNPAECRRMAPALALFHFDTAVNHGVGTAIRILQEAVGAAVDGEIGPETRRRIANVSPTDALAAYAELRRERYRRLAHFWRFGRGWMRRVDITLIRAGELIAVSAAPRRDDARRAEPPDQDEPRQKGETHMTTDDITPGPSPKWWGESMTIWGVLVTAASTVLPTIGPLFGLDITGEMIRQIGQHVTEIVQALGGIVGTLLAIYGRVRASHPIERRLVSIKL